MHRDKINVDIRLHIIIDPCSSSLNFHFNFRWLDSVSHHTDIVHRRPSGWLLPALVLQQHARLRPGQEAHHRQQQHHDRPVLAQELWTAIASGSQVQKREDSADLNRPNSIRSDSIWSGLMRSNHIRFDTLCFSVKFKKLTWQRGTLWWTVCNLNVIWKNARLG